MVSASEAELQVRFRRAAYNRALAEADLAAIAPLLSPDVVLVTGTDSALIAGRKAQLAAWKREFSALPRTIYVRTTQSVIASPVEPIVMEHGNWQGAVQGSGSVIASGTYAAKWRHFSPGWMLVAEIFVTLG
ncbi:nuclear transport factor 2 family protein [Novosphingobium sp. ERN07]|uniref:nuclear transport factor 2 family protein n=1 Tax=Novosphingobium sp. ERN07 TaxID=2726187 RepID=UPI0014574DB6|nr:nuclear transport factor 2 family protein [Novosphingobium sp. ERN07]NLR69889.1 nuclear transport factor 2 family protein [Novosphingobium sp. ERN07]